MRPGLLLHCLLRRPHQCLTLFLQQRSGAREQHAEASVIASDEQVVFATFVPYTVPPQGTSAAVVAFFKKRFYLFILGRGEEGEKERERNINVRLPLPVPLLETWPPKDNPGMCPDWELNL